MTPTARLALLEKQHDETTRVVAQRAHERLDAHVSTYHRRRKQPVSRPLLRPTRRDCTHRPPQERNSTTALEARVSALEALVDQLAKQAP